MQGLVMGLLEFGHPWISHTTFVERRSRTSPWLYAGIYFGSVCVHAGRLLKSGETLSASLRAATCFKCGGPCPNVPAGGGTIFRWCVLHKRAGVGG
ncbi:hypothetical protein IG631_11069 [Alternaria alternata]|nr:hypothetical protein IG631_11069 [Alternaria alternata]